MEEEKKVDTHPEEEINYTTNTSSETEEINPDTIIPENVNLQQEETTEEFVKPKKSLFLKILFGIIIFLLLLLITGAVLYFTGFFEHKEETKKIEEPVAHEVAKVEPVSENTTKFEIKDINSKKLNEQLANLNNKNLSEEKKLLEKEKEDSLKQKIKDDEKKLDKELAVQKKEELAITEKERLETEPPTIGNKKIQEESILAKSSTSNEIQHNNINNTDIKKESSTNNQFLLLINVAKIKGQLYKKYLDKITAINPNVKLCRDDKNRIEIYFGPFEKNEDRIDLLNKLLKNKFEEAYSVELTQEEFNKRCNY